jgi:hypothetical protein
LTSVRCVRLRLVRSPFLASHTVSLSLSFMRKAGPEEYTHREVVEYVFEQIRTEEPEVRRLAAAQAS